MTANDIFYQLPQCNLRCSMEQEICPATILPKRPFYSLRVLPLWVFPGGAVHLSLEFHAGTN